MRKLKINYSLLIIIMFAVICFLTDYIVINRKLRKDSTINTNIENSYESILGCYQGYPIDMENDNGIAGLSLYSDGTYSFGWAPGLHTIGNYIIVDNKLYMNDLFSVGSDPTMEILDSSRILTIGEESTLYDNDMIINADDNNYKGVKFIKKSECSSENSFDLAMKNLQKYYMERNNGEKQSSTTDNQSVSDNYAYIGSLINIPKYSRFENIVNSEINISIINGNISIKMDDKSVLLQTSNAKELYWYAYHETGKYYLVYITEDNNLKAFKSDVLSIIKNGNSDSVVVANDVANFVEIDNESSGNGLHIGMENNEANYNFYYLVRNTKGNIEKIVFDTVNR